ncbi:hypothetical protein P154DRAFT_119142 [Amniculicola lignicola CBS 123094]|uniref:Uncharacterized protein n=1 Tax=Amniculicola lignicola CBS 123094 TaxID=1392246 RepID=A0A6A5X3D1_9PLEO|nr:hypothetical protein P154DRAFT_119142 [Amniculicola lignicola CBS 123094]
MSPPWRIAQPYCLALGPQVNSPEPIWYIGCKVCDGEDKIFYSQTYFDINYPDLSRWTTTIPAAARNVYVSFGPNLTYFACAPGRGSIWAGLPGELTDKIQKAFDTPCCVSLGMNDAWFVMWPDGYFVWKFYGKYAPLDAILNAAEPRSVSYLAISPFNPDHYFVAFKDRSIKYNFIGAEEWLPQMRAAFDEWQQDIMLRQRQSMMPPPQYQGQMINAPGQQWNQFPPSPATPNYIPQQMQGPPNPGYNAPMSPPFTPATPYGAPMQPIQPMQPMQPMQPPMQPMQPVRPMAQQLHAYPMMASAPVEMMGDIPVVAAPPPVAPLPRSTSTEKGGFLSKFHSKKN